ncbi:MAG: hypothetical protein KAQ66_09235 [Rhodospirillaceae bacterium]|nr:hypothetical protein [Rhodospirillaceae bacterium]
MINIIKKLLSRFRPTATTWNPSSEKRVTKSRPVRPLTPKIAHLGLFFMVMAGHSELC